jgi:membrane protease YdiL (CAAX protease family)
VKTKAVEGASVSGHILRVVPHGRDAYTVAAFAAAYYGFLIGVFVPVICIRSYFRLKAGARFPPKPALRRQTLNVHGILFFFAWFVWRSFGQQVFPSYAIQWKHAALGLAILIIFVCGMYPIWKSNAVCKRDRVYRNAPQAANEMPGWIAISITAGFAEEIAYRGVLFGILMYWIQNWWAAALLCALAFALGHAIQGWKATLIIFVMSVIFQGLVWYTGTLYVAMVVHAIYDVIAGFAYLRLYKLTAPEVSTAAAPSVV